ncbi:MAG: hypothetical protein AB1Z23_09760 [Eubacteriales bacterium]
MGLWDELRLWGAYPKALYTFESLQFGENSTLYSMMQLYTPGLPLFGYFITCFSSEFNENLLFFAYSFLGLLFMIPFTKYLKWEKWHNIFIMTFAIVFLPHFIYMYIHYVYYYQSLYVDALLGICIGYCFWLANDNNYNDFFSSIKLLTALTLPILLKDSGFFFSVICLLASVLHLKESFKKKINYKVFINVIMTISAVILVYLSWKYIKKVHDINSTFVFVFDGTLLKSILMTIKKLILSPIPYMIFMPLSIEFIYSIKTKNNTKTKNWLRIIRIIAYIVFVLGYVAVFRPSIYYETIFPSLNRYMGSIVLCELFIFAISFAEFIEEKDFVDILSKTDSRRDLNAKKLIRVSTAAVLVIISILLIKGFRKFDGGIYEQADEISEQIVEASSVDNYDEVINVYFVSQGIKADDSLLHHRIYFNLIDDKILIKNFYNKVNITKYGINITADEFASLLVSEHYDYVYLLNSNEEFTNSFSSIFGANLSSDTKNRIYRVDVKGDDARLVEVD